jgi:hypothetical protein
MKFGGIIASQSKRFPRVRFFDYDRFKRLLVVEELTRTAFQMLLKIELSLLDTQYEKLMEEDECFLYKWSQLNAVALVKITKKWNRRCGTDVAASDMQILTSDVSALLAATRFFTAENATRRRPDTCAICLGSVVNPVWLSFSCPHYFCAVCAEQTACAQRGRCPLCRDGTTETLALERVPDTASHGDVPRPTGDWPPAALLLSSLEKLDGVAGGVRLHQDSNDLVSSLKSHTEESTEACLAEDCHEAQSTKFESTLLAMHTFISCAVIGTSYGPHYATVVIFAMLAVRACMYIPIGEMMYYMEVCYWINLVMVLGFFAPAALSDVLKPAMIPLSFVPIVAGIILKNQVKFSETDTMISLNLHTLLPFTTLLHAADFPCDCALAAKIYTTWFCCYTVLRFVVMVPLIKARKWGNLVGHCVPHDFVFAELAWAQACHDEEDQSAERKHISRRKWHHPAVNDHLRRNPAECTS